MPNSGIQGSKTFEKNGFTWSDITSGGLSVRFKPVFHKIDSKAPTGILNDEAEDVDIYDIIGYGNSVLVQEWAKVLNPTISFKVGNFRNLPFKKFNNESVRLNVKENIVISKRNWDSRELSFEFNESPLLLETPSLEQAYQTWQEQVTQDFFELHTNEEELNRIFIDIYGLQEEHTHQRWL